MSQNGAQQAFVPIAGADGDVHDLLHRDMRAERRKMQNRINQRAYRMRQNYKSHEPTRPRRWKVIGSLRGGYPEHARSESVHNPSSHLSTNFPHTEDSEGEILCRLAPSCQRKRAYQFELTAHRDYMEGTPQVDHLLTLVKFNVYRALAENMNVLGMDIKEWMHADAISPFCTFQPQPFDRVIPIHLQPTAIQRAVPHHPWLDFFPHPRMRDRLIFAANIYDDEQLCIDIMGFWNTDVHDPALIVWGQPWEIANWEMSDAFVKKWGWTVQDCPELFKSTNTWRALRGEKRLLLK
ncbi:hypothetical protein BDV30DRAFT_217052 [Aspergillus minisclerotigenes]|uniref:BZIP domain-containing protein n=1 Tax=Aspergillus minisclerotigenes TaxID=656917 RepID=A0A5N6ISG5_9EURO|nr:hypothetical protein BDV30DRAFT_217052 [Aspergillus minisclerotigenes]